MRKSIVALALLAACGGGPVRPVPDVVGLTGDKAYQRLVSVGFRLHAEFGPGCSVDELKGTVVGQHPKAGVRHKTGSAVVVTIKC